MMKFLVIVFFIFGCSHMSLSEDFVKVQGTHFELGNKEYQFMGTNFWYGANLGASSKTRPRLIRELDRLAKLGVKNLRISAGSEGPDSEPYRMTPSMQIAPGKYNQSVLVGLDFLLDEMRKRNMKAILVLNNYWNWSGGMGQYLVWANFSRSIPYPPPHPGGSWSEYQKFVSNFYSNKKAVSFFNDHIKFMVNRKNTVSNMLYKNDPAVMAWELANEPRADWNVKGYRKWIHESAKLIKSLDSNHLVTTGSEGDTPYPSAGMSLIDDHKSEFIDYATIHIWVQNWNIYDPKDASTLKKARDFALSYIKKHEIKAVELGKPVVLEEFGISRDLNSHNPNSTVKMRDSYYADIFKVISERTQLKSSPIQGVNFWAWGGEGRPANIGGLWMAGDDFIGDPPHEFQGWYSIYDTDTSTNKIIKKFADEINTHN